MTGAGVAVGTGAGALRVAVGAAAPPAGVAVGDGAPGADVAVGAGAPGAGVSVGAGAWAAGVSVGAGTVDVADWPQEMRKTRTTIPATSNRLREFLHELRSMLVPHDFLVAPNKQAFSEVISAKDRLNSLVFNPDSKL